MAINKGKNILIDLSSSSTSSDDNGDEDETSFASASSASGDECESVDDEDYDIYMVDDEESEEVEEEHDSSADDDHSLAKRVIHFLEGNVCKGDLVLFKQKVYGSFGKVTRNGKLLGKRTVAGRIVKDSYGAAKQQHTFTVEVLWSKGVKKLPPLFPLLIKGRNLYRLTTYRQLWEDEGERRKALAEKHRRGTVARCNRAKRMNALSNNPGGKSRKVSHCRRSSEMSFLEGHKHFGTEQGASSSTDYCNSKHYNVKQRATKNPTRAQFTKPFRRPQKLGFRVSKSFRATSGTP